MKRIASSARAASTPVLIRSSRWTTTPRSILRAALAVRNASEPVQRARCTAPRAGTSSTRPRALVEAAKAILKHFEDNICFINFLTDVTTLCDCTVQQRPFIPDLGALASHDVISIEQASILRAHSSSCGTEHSRRGRGRSWRDPVRSCRAAGAGV